MTALCAESGAAAAQSGEHRWGGLLFDAFARETSGGGVEAWSAEDGGRIRHRNPGTGAWSFQSVPDEVKDTLHRLFFLPGTDTGWAVGQGGWVLKSINGGTTWTTLGSRIAAPAGGDDPYEELYDIHFLTASDGWMVGLHSIWSTGDGGLTWTNLGNPYDPVGQEFYNLHLDFVELYAIDVVQRPDGSRLGLISAQPGVVFRSTDANLATWELAWNITSLCASGGCGSVLAPCACDICPGGADHPGPWFEAWDIEISRHAAQPLALVSGGVGSQCGMIFASTDDGVSWSKEWHECTCTGTGCIDCSGLALYNDDPSDPSDLNRLKSFRTLYGLGIFDDNTAVAAGYNGQHVLRDAATGVWQDRSVFAAGVPTVAGSVTFPLVGADAVSLVSGGRVGVYTGMGGHLRESTDGGQTWTDSAVGEPHRIADVCFVNAQTGWRVGQFFRISRSVDFGITWDEQIPKSAPVGGHFRAIACELSSNQQAVAVGDPALNSAEETTTIPKIRYTDFQKQPDWYDNPVIVNAGSYQSFLDGKSLHDVTWTGSEFWAVGQGGIAMKSANGGATWHMVLPETTSAIADFQMEGVAFRDAPTGLIVGRRPVNGVMQGVAYQYRDVGGSITWTAIGLPTGLQITGLWDVAIAGDTAWTVGEKLVNNEPVGVVLTASFASGTFGALSEVGPAGGFPRCVTGEAFDEIPVLNQVAVAPGSGEVWAGGACGRLWVRSGAGVWSEVKSQTDAHILGMSFVSTGGSSAVGFLAGFRSGGTQQCIVRVQ